MKLKPCFALLMVVTCLYVQAQPTLTTQKVLGGSADDILTCMVLTKDGGLIAGGTSYSGISGNKTAINKGGSDYWIVKRDKNGNKEWDKTFGGDGNDNLRDIQQTKDGGYILAGRSESGISGDKTVAGNAWVVKLDSAANIEWDKTYSGYRADEYNVYTVQKVVPTKDKGYILNIYIISPDPYNSPIWMVKTDSLGNYQWDNISGGETLSTTSSSVLQTNDDGYMIGYTSYYHTQGGRYYGVTKLDKNGNTRWFKTYVLEDDTNSILQNIVEIANGNFILGGSSDSYAGIYKSEDSHDGQSDFWLLEVDSLGNYVRDKIIGGSYKDNLASMVKTKDHGLILGGYSYSDASYEKSENNRGGSITSPDYWIVKLNSAGTIEWDKTIGGDTTDILAAIQERKQDEYILAGYTYSGISGDKTKASKGGADYWLTHILYNNTITSFNDENLKTQVINIPESSPTVYPNPVKGFLYIKNAGNHTLFILTAQDGKIVKTQKINGNGMMDVATLAAGVYYLKNSSTGKTEKIIIVK